MEDKFAKLVSFIFQPLLMPTLGFLILLQMPAFFAIVIPSTAKWMLIGIVFFMTFFLPASVIYFMIRKGMISSLYIDARNERTVPYIITLIVFSVTYFMIARLEIASVYSLFILSALILVLSILVINLFWKISSHMAATGALVGMTIGLSVYVGVLFLNLVLSAFVVAGFVAYARLRLNAHTPAQVYAGFFLGLLMGSIPFIIFS